MRHGSRYPPAISQTLARTETLARIESRLTPLLGEMMARASVRAQCQKLEISQDPLEPAQIERLLDALAKGLRVFVGGAKTAEVMDGLLDSIVEGSA